MPIISRFVLTELSLGFYELNCACTQVNCMGGTKEIKGVKKDVLLIYN